VTTPEDAVEEARTRAAIARAQNAYPDVSEGFAVEPVERVTRDRLLDWGLIESRPEVVRSTRVLGAPITWLKRMLVRLLRQQQEQLSYDQTRFNLNMVVYAHALAERVSELEAEVTRLRGADPGGRATPGADAPSDAR
jgi:hypothetical protein